MDVKESKTEIFCPRPTFDYRETLGFWRRREGKLVPEFVLKAFMAAGDDIRAKEDLLNRKKRPHVAGSTHHTLTLLWWSVTVLFLTGLLGLLMSDRFAPNLFVDDCSCHSLFEVLGWDALGTLPDVL
ncbi:uncharacterized protein [Haliotis asinina]|uniref:uncharacterized protein n=1 Tax=Haliotis asinina TaxID=109174 RepID=UPI0035323EF7